MTPNDNREMERPPRMRTGGYWQRMLDTFAGCAAAGAELLSIESVGGKEVHDTALTWCDIRQVIFALCIMGVRDMRHLWRNIAAIAQEHGIHAAGDTACGFGNTAMAMAEQRLIPDVFAAIVRPITAIRSLVAYECGAVGPGKDCAYENPILKAITGFPMAMEGKTAACAHLSHLGNIAAATCDVWSNESVQNLKLLGGMAPTCYLEQLEYDCRLMNQAVDDGEARRLRDWFVHSDERLNPQAFVLSPDSTIAFAQAIVAADTPYHAGIAVAREAVTRIRTAVAAGRLAVKAQELPFLDRVAATLDTLPDDEDAFIAEMMTTVDTAAFVPADYDLA
jgi:methanol--5-hydroxybenzimidazolylcobamide Co-methyltransferase